MNISLPAYIDKLTIRQKMLGIFGLMMLILAIIALHTVISLVSIKNRTVDVVDVHTPLVVNSLRFSEYVKDAVGNLGLYMLSKEESQKQGYLDSINAAESMLANLKASAPGLDNETSHHRLVTSIENSLAALRSHEKHLFVLAENTAENFPAMDYSAKNINPLSQQILHNINIMMQSETERISGKPRLELVTLLNDMRYAWARLMSGIRAYLGFRNTEALEEVSNYDTRFLSLLDTLRSKFGDQLELEQEEALEQFDALHESFLEHYGTAVKLHSSSAWRQDSYLISNEINALVSALNGDIETLIAQSRNNINSISESLIATANRSTVIIVTLLLVALAATVGFSFLLTRGILNPITRAVDTGLKAIDEAMETLSSGSYNPISQIKSDGKDEIAHAATTFNVMSRALVDAAEYQQKVADELREKIDLMLAAVRRASEGDLSSQMIEFSGNDAIDELGNNVQQMINSLNALVAQVQHSGIQVTSSATEIAATSKQQEATVSEQAASTNQIMATATEISATSRELVNTMDEVSGVAESTAHAATQGQSALTSMEETMRQMKDATDTIAAKLAVMSEKAGNIYSVVTTINKVADQTNLLSLNAAIEAEKAGEYGLGFAVVATEIRRLADQTAVATWDIEQMVKEMQSAVSAGVMGMDKFSEEVSQGVGEINRIGVQLAAIIEQVQALTPRFESVNEGMQSQSQGAQQISESMVQLNELAQHTAESLRQSNSSIQQLKDAAQGLQKEVSQFTVSM